MKAHIVLLPGDGIGPEVVGAATRVLAAVGRRFDHQFFFHTHPIGGAALRGGLPPLPPATLRACLEADAVLLGAVGDPAFDTAPPDRRPERALLQLRQELGVYANLRPARMWDGLEHSSPLKADRLGGTDVLIVRELTGGLYFGEPRGFAPDGASAVNTLRYSREEIARVAEIAFAAARGRRRLLTSVDKANVLETSQLWRSVVTALAANYPDVRLEHMYVDACAMMLTLQPARFDVVLTENLFGDILSDEAGAVVGSLGLLPSASLGEGRGLFEPVHGSAPDLAGKNRANPVGAILSAGMLLQYGLHAESEGDAVDRAVAAALGRGARTADLSPDPKTETLGTREMTGAILEELAR